MRWRCADGSKPGDWPFGEALRTPNDGSDESLGEPRPQGGSGSYDSSNSWTYRPGDGGISTVGGSTGTLGSSGAASAGASEESYVVRLGASADLDVSGRHVSIQQQLGERRGAGKKPPSVLWAIGAAALVGLLLAISLVAVFRFFVGKTSQVVAAGIDEAERAEAMAAISRALRAEEAVYASTGSFTDDSGRLEEFAPEVRWAVGKDPVEKGFVYVSICDVGSRSVMLQYVSSKGHVFAAYSSADAVGDYFALGPTDCPRLVAGVPAGWSVDALSGWSGPSGDVSPESPDQQLPPPVVAPRLPEVPDLYGTPSAGGSKSGSGSSRSGGGAPAGSDYAYPY